ncbi:AAA family ATPase [Desulfatitalea alkaliphila]|uniref:Cytidylate kinase-like family protein n=1 Tax=Desulfatitalea alkaliphila TaxID=2929485 RepID=A0AA41R7D2_9BACT|nr:cytidylate kinase-like family protein [Desulfatitalea alkaliphila]MCJ8502882.1 cytidylate kinase-like family protein [Desulfatitalea alkaliphila]
MAVITIARQFGAGGRTLGLRLANALGYRFLDDVVIHELARRVNVTHEAVQDIENIAGGFFSKAVTAMLSKSYMDRMTGEEFGYIDETIYAKTLKEVILDLAKNDNIILLGRGSPLFLEGHPKTLHFLLVAEKKDRVAFIREHYNLTAAEAEKDVEIGDKKRRNLYSLFKNYNYKDPLHYHMVFNASLMTLDEILQEIVTFVQRSRGE